MKVVFRVDASIDMGTGHVMRCLTLADGFREQGADCRFICREHQGSLLNLIRQRGFSVSALAVCEYMAQPMNETRPQLPTHAVWLGCDWIKDAQQTAEILSNQKPDWLVVDHYALDGNWEALVSDYADQLMVIDDLADRIHACDLLLDQNLGRKVSDYTDLVPEHCMILVGPKYALLRPEFAALREYSLQRRKNAKVQQVLISMGGVDQHNATGKVLDALKSCLLPKGCLIIVVMGQNAPWLRAVQQQANTLPWRTEVLVNINDMAQRMADSDLAIGAGGATSWERCCLGLPTLLMVLAENQKSAVIHMVRDGLAQTLTTDASLSTILQRWVAELVSYPEQLAIMTEQASKVTNGNGCQLVVRAIESN